MKKPPVHSINILNELEAEYPRFFFPLTFKVKNKEELFIMAVVLGFIGGAAVSKSQIFANDTADSNLPQSGEEISDESDPLNTAVYIDEDKQNIEINDEIETHFNKEELSTPEEPAIPGNFSNESLNIEQNETEDNLDDYYYIKNSNSIQVDSSIYSPNNSWNGFTDEVRLI